MFSTSFFAQSYRTIRETIANYLVIPAGTNLIGIDRTLHTVKVFYCGEIFDLAICEVSPTDVVQISDEVIQAVAQKINGISERIFTQKFFQFVVPNVSYIYRDIELRLTPVSDESYFDNSLREIVGYGMSVYNSEYLWSGYIYANSTADAYQRICDKYFELH